MTAYSAGRAGRRPLFAAASGKLGLVTVLGMLLSILASPAGAVDDVIDGAVDDVISLIPGTVAQISGGGLHTCAVTTDGDAYCWGRNTRGQLGIGDGMLPDGHSGIPVKVHVLGSGTAAGAVAQISAGDEHTCAVTTGGDAYCWGRAAFGRLGTGSSIGNLDIPTQVLPGAGLTPGTVARISAGYLHTCAITADGDAYCWGRNFNGQLGNDNVISLIATPVQVLSGEGLTPGAVAQISAGQGHTCAVTDSGEAYCWGRNAHGMLGDGTDEDRDTPVQVVPGEGLAPGTVAQIDPGRAKTCAVTSGGDAYCWGSGIRGQLGNGTTGTASFTPVQVVPGEGLASGTVAQISADGLRACATTTDGDAYCWGGNDSGELGNGTFDNSSAPVQVGAGLIPETVEQIDAGSGHTCATDTLGNAYCWGVNTWGQLGDGTNPTTEADPYIGLGGRPVPAPVLPLALAIQ